MLKETNLHGWPAISLETAAFSLTAPLAVGPRVMDLRRPGGENLFYEFPGQQGGSGEAEHLLRGGHRLWHSPEHPVRTYQPDNQPVQCRKTERGFSLEGPVEEKTGLRKSLILEAQGEAVLAVAHELTNEGLWPVPCAAWPLTMLRRGGFGVVPLLPKGEHPRDLLPSYSIVPWTYTDLSEPCWQFRPSTIGIDTTVASRPQKLGLTAYPGWSAYWLDGDTFIKFSPPQSDVTYPDFGCCFETFCNDTLIELETLGPLLELAPGETTRHLEYWGVLPGLPCPNEESVYRDAFLPAVQKWLASIRL